MRAITTEYGNLVIAVLIAAVGIYIFSGVLFGKQGSTVFQGVSFMYNSHALHTKFEGGEWVGDRVNPLSSITGFGDNTVLGKNTAPRFPESSTNTLNKVIPILDSKLDKLACDPYDIFQVDSLVVESATSGSWIVVPGAEVNMVVLEYTPECVPVGDNNFILVEEWYDAVDSFGNRIRNDRPGGVNETENFKKGSDGYMKTKRIKYDCTLYTNGDTAEIESLKDSYVYNSFTEDGVGSSTHIFEDTKVLDDFVLRQDIPCKYKVIYRYTDPDTKLKCEYIALFTNTVLTEYEKNFGEIVVTPTPDPDGGTGEEEVTSLMLESTYVEPDLEDTVDEEVVE